METGEPVRRVATGLASRLRLKPHEIHVAHVHEFRRHRAGVSFEIETIEKGKELIVKLCRHRAGVSFEIETTKAEIVDYYRDNVATGLASRLRLKQIYKQSYYGLQSCRHRAGVSFEIETVTRHERFSEPSPSPQGWRLV